MQILKKIFTIRNTAFLVASLSILTTLYFHFFVDLKLGWLEITSYYTDLRILYFNISAILISFLIILFFFSKEKDYIILSDLLIISLGLIFVFTQQVFPVSDESSHYDYLKYVQEHWRIPNVYSEKNIDLIEQVNGQILGSKRYIAFHPPLYYFFGAVITSVFAWFQQSLINEVYLLRTFGVLCLILSSRFIYKTFDLLKKYEFKFINIQLVKVSVLITVLNPALLTRITNITNEQFSILFTTISFYFLTKFLLEKQVTKITQVGLVVFVSLAILSKLTSFFLIPLLILVYIYRKKYYSLAANLGFIFLSILPWVLFNIKTYHQIFANNAHVEVVQGMVGSDLKNLNLSFTFSNFESMLITFWQAQEFVKPVLLIFQTRDLFFYKTISSLNSFIIYSFSFLFLLSFISLTKNTLIRGLKKDWQQFIFYILYMTPVIFLSIFLVYSTIKYDLDFMIGRYLHVLILPLAFILCYGLNYFFAEKEHGLLTKTLALLCILFISIAINNLIFKVF